MTQLTPTRLSHKGCLANAFSMVAVVTLAYIRVVIEIAFNNILTIGGVGTIYNYLVEICSQQLSLMDRGGGE